MTHCRTALLLLLFGAFAVLPVYAIKKKYNPPTYRHLPQKQGPDPERRTQWYLDAVRAPQAWALVPKSAPAVAVGVVDSGVNYMHPDLQANLLFNPLEWPINGIDDDGNRKKDDYLGWNFRNSRPEPWDDNGHGTLIAGVIASVHNNGAGGQGVCPVCKILPLRFLDEDGYGNTPDAIKAIYYAARRGVKVLNLSFGDRGVDEDLRRALDFAGAHDVLVVIAAGNWSWDNDENPVFPANMDSDYTITVGAVSQDDDLWEGSSWGQKHVHLGAPGEKVAGPYVEDSWDEGDGTSLAAPIVAGTAGLVRAANPNLNAATTKKILEATVHHLPALTGKFRKAGIVNAEAAVRCALDPALPCLSE